MAVKGYCATRNPLVPVLGVMVFILCGAEHIIADIFYMTLAGEFPVGFYITVLLGNAFGGGLFQYYGMEEHGK